MNSQCSCVIVDDHEVVRTGTRMRLSDVEWLDVIGEAESVRTGTRLVLDRHPDLAIVDMRLPDGSGLDIVEAITADGGDTLVVLYSGNATTAQAEAALESGVAGFVLKDSPLANVVQALDAARAGRRYIDPTIAADLLAPRSGRALSPRELEILTCMADGKQNAGIGRELGISPETVKAHVSNILVKLDVVSRAHAVATALRDGIIE